MSCAAIAGSYVNVASGPVARVLDTRKGRILGQSYKTCGVEFMRKGSPEFAFRVDGKMYDGHSVWKDVKVSDEKAKNGSRTVTVSAVSADDVAGLELAYTTYPGIALVRKTLKVSNRSDKEFFVTDVDVETFRLPYTALNCESSHVLRRFGRYREEGGVYIGDWNDPLVVAHDYKRRCGIAIGNEGVSTMKRTTVFECGDFVVSGL